MAHFTLVREEVQLADRPGLWFKVTRPGYYWANEWGGLSFDFEDDTVEATDDDLNPVVVDDETIKAAIKACKFSIKEVDVDWDSVDAEREDMAPRRGW